MKCLKLFSADGFLHICRDLDDRQFVSYDTFDVVKKSPECIVIRASILAIGFQSGTVKWLLNKQLSKVPMVDLSLISCMLCLLLLEAMQRLVIFRFAAKYHAYSYPTQ